jgi:hypothetical protein
MEATWMCTAGRLEQFTDQDADDDLPVSTQVRVFWLCRGGVWLREAGMQRVLGTGDCLEPDVHYGQGAWSCHGRLKRFDGATGQEFPGETGASAAVRLQGDRLVKVTGSSGSRSAQAIAPVGLPFRV